MPAPARAKSAEFASATLSVSVLRPPTHLAKAASVAAAFGSVLCGNPTQPLGRSVDRSTMPFSCGSNAGDSPPDRKRSVDRSTMPFSCGSNAGDGEAGLLVTFAVAVVAADELPHPARTTTNPAAHARTRYLLLISLPF